MDKLKYSKTTYNGAFNKIIITKIIIFSRNFCIQTNSQAQASDGSDFFGVVIIVI